MRNKLIMVASGAAVGLVTAVLSPMSALAASVQPSVVEGNPTCEDLGYAHGFKPNVPSEDNPTGQHSLPGNNTLTVDVTADANGKPIVEWSSTLTLDAVIVKGGPRANVYRYDPESGGDSNLVTPVNNGGQVAGLSHLEFCYDLDVQVSKTANTSFDREWTWSISKEADQSAVTLASGESTAINYTVTVSADPTDSNWAVAGDITIANPDPTYPANVTSVTDEITEAIQAPVDCPSGSEFEIAPNGSATCTYSQSLPDASSRVNTATATTTGKVGGGSGSADVVFGPTATNETDECVTVSDDKWSLGNVEVCAGESPKTISYAVNATGPQQCGTSTVVNTATLTTNDTGATKEATASVEITVPCGGCTFTQGYWKTHSAAGPAPYDDAWKNLGPAEHNTAFFQSGKTWLQVFNTAPQGNAYFILAHQYMAATLNQLNGATGAPAAVLASSQALFSNVSGTTLTAAQKRDAQAWAATLDAYNNGLTGPGHCSE